MRILAVSTLAVLFVAGGSGGRPAIFHTRVTAAAGDTVAVRVVRTPPGAARLLLEPGRIALDPAVFVGRQRRAGVRTTIPNVPPGTYRLALARGRQILARSRRPLRIVDPSPGLRDCRSSVYGRLASGWERNALHAGPISLVGAANGVRRDGVTGNRPVKVLLVLENEAVATVRVTRRDRRHVALLYAERGAIGEFNDARRVADGLPAVRFEGCPAGRLPHTQFNGGFIVDAPRCAHLTVEVARRAKPLAVDLPVGAPC